MASKHQLSERELEDLRASVLGDLEWLQKDDLTVAGEDHLRELSARLRRLLVEGTLQRLRKADGAGGEPEPASMPEPASYIALDEARNGIRVLDLDLVYGQLTAIGQQLRESPQVKQLTPDSQRQARNEGPKAPASSLHHSGRSMAQGCVRRRR